MNELLHYFPSMKYIERNWQPEQIGQHSLKALAEAEKLARSQGVLSPALADKFMPNALVEGWANSFGVVNGTYGYPANPRRDEVIRKMGLTMANSDDPALIKKWSNVERDTKAGYRLKHDASPSQYARLAAAILAEKARLYGEDKAIERWNGKGSAVEEDYGALYYADAENHARKVNQMAEMLNSPANAKIRNYYRQLVR